MVDVIPHATTGGRATTARPRAALCAAVLVGRRRVSPRCGAGGSTPEACSAPRRRRRRRCSARSPPAAPRRWPAPVTATALAVGRSRPRTTRRSSSSSAGRSRWLPPPSQLRCCSTGTHVAGSSSTGAGAVHAVRRGRGGRCRSARCSLLTLAVAVDATPPHSGAARGRPPSRSAIGMVLVPTAVLTASSRVAPAAPAAARHRGRPGPRVLAVVVFASRSSRIPSCSRVRRSSPGRRSGSVPRRSRGPASCSSPRPTGRRRAAPARSSTSRRPATPSSSCRSTARSRCSATLALAFALLERDRAEWPAARPRNASGAPSTTPPSPWRSPRSKGASRRRTGRSASCSPCPTTRWWAASCGRCRPDDSGEHELPARARPTRSRRRRVS